MNPTREELRIWWCDKHENINTGFPNPANGRYYCRGAYEDGGDCSEREVFLVDVSARRLLDPPDYEAAAQVLADNDGIEILQWHDDLAKRIVDAALGGRLLEEKP